MWYVYVLLCDDGSLYTGSTNDIKKRFEDHRGGKGAKYTRSHKPVKVVYQEQLDSKSEALKRENEIKGWKRKEKLKKLNITLMLDSLTQNSL